MQCLFQVNGVLRFATVLLHTANVSTWLDLSNQFAIKWVSEYRVIDGL